jgi:Glycosyltransferase like family
MDWALVSAVNNEQVLQANLLSSPDASSARDVVLQRGYTSAASAYNAALETSRARIVVFAHQDVYFPQGWLARVDSAIAKIEATDPHWGVLGVWGVRANGKHTGHLYCAGLQEEIGERFEDGRPVRTLDEVVLIVRRDARLRFDAGLTGFHLYGTDICLTAASQGMGCYAISAYCVHNTNGYAFLPYQFWRDALYIRRKWWSQLPIDTPCLRITVGCQPMITWNARRFVNAALGRVNPGRRLDDPRVVNMVRPFAPSDLSNKRA